MQNLRFVRFDESFDCECNAKSLYLSAFPLAERMPYRLFKRYAEKDNVDFFAAYDKSSFVGIVYNVYYKDIVYIFYLAVNPALRGKGYGSGVLSAVKEKYSDRRIVLNIEECVENCDNYPQRLKRKEFYEKNGFFKLDYKVKEANVIYDMMCFSNDGRGVSKKEYMMLMENYFGEKIYKLFYKRLSK